MDSSWSRARARTMPTMGTRLRPMGRTPTANSKAMCRPSSTNSRATTRTVGSTNRPASSLSGARTQPPHSTWRRRGIESVLATRHEAYLDISSGPVSIRLMPMSSIILLPSL